MHNPKNENRWYTWTHPLTRGIVYAKMRYGEGYYVSILPDARNIWLENGTQERVTKGRKITDRKKGWVHAYNSKTGKEYNRKAILAERVGKGHRTGRIADGKFTFFNPTVQREGDNAINRIKSSVEEALKKYGVE